MKTSEILERAELSEKYEVDITDEQRKRLVPQGRIPQQVCVSWNGSSEAAWDVLSGSMELVEVFNPGVEKKHEFVWDGVGYNLHGRYLLVLSGQIEEFEKEMDAYLESSHLFDDEECCPRAAVEKAVAKWKAKREESK